MITVVKCLFVLATCGLVLGCVPRDRVPDDTEAVHAPTAPNKSDYVKPAVAADYRTGMWMYRQSLIAYVGRLTDYINEIALVEGFDDGRGNICRFPFEWTPITLPDTPPPTTTDPVVVNGILATHIRELRRLIKDTNAKYAHCVK